MNLKDITEAEGRRSVRRGVPVAGVVVVVVFFAINFWPVKLPDCTDMGESVRDLLKEQYRAEFQGQLSDEALTRFGTCQRL